MTLNPDTVDTNKVTTSFNVPETILRYIEDCAAIETEGNRSMALSKMLRKLARYEQAEAEGRLKVIRAQK